jgi:hypothetical protein
MNFSTVDNYLVKAKEKEKAHQEKSCRMRILGEYVLGPAHVFPLIKHRCGHIFLLYMFW